MASDQPAEDLDLSVVCCTASRAAIRCLFTSRLGANAAALRLARQLGDGSRCPDVYVALARLTSVWLKELADAVITRVNSECLFLCALDCLKSVTARASLATSATAFLLHSDTAAVVKPLADQGASFVRQIVEAVMQGVTSLAAASEDAECIACTTSSILCAAHARLAASLAAPCNLLAGLARHSSLHAGMLVALVPHAERRRLRSVALGRFTVQCICRNLEGGRFVRLGDDFSLHVHICPACSSASASAAALGAATQCDDSSSDVEAALLSAAAQLAAAASAASSTAAASSKTSSSAAATTAATTATAAGATSEPPVSASTSAARGAPVIGSTAAARPARVFAAIGLRSPAPAAVTVSVPARHTSQLAALPASQWDVSAVALALSQEEVRLGCETDAVNAAEMLPSGDAHTRGTASGEAVVGAHVKARRALRHSDIHSAAAHSLDSHAVEAAYASAERPVPSCVSQVAARRRVSGDADVAASAGRHSALPEDSQRVFPLYWMDELTSGGGSRRVSQKRSGANAAEAELMRPQPDVASRLSTSPTPGGANDTSPMVARSGTKTSARAQALAAAYATPGGLGPECGRREDSGMHSADHAGTAVADNVIPGRAASCAMTTSRSGCAAESAWSRAVPSYPATPVAAASALHASTRAKHRCDGSEHLACSPGCPCRLPQTTAAASAELTFEPASPDDLPVADDDRESERAVLGDCSRAAAVASQARRRLLAARRIRAARVSLGASFVQLSNKTGTEERQRQVEEDITDRSDAGSASPSSGDGLDGGRSVRSLRRSIGRCSLADELPPWSSSKSAVRSRNHRRSDDSCHDNRGTDAYTDADADDGFGSQLAAASFPGGRADSLAPQLYLADTGQWAIASEAAASAFMHGSPAADSASSSSVGGSPGSRRSGRSDRSGRSSGSAASTSGCGRLRHAAVRSQLFQTAGPAQQMCDAMASLASGPAQQMCDVMASLASGPAQQMCDVMASLASASAASTSTPPKQPSATSRPREAVAAASTTQRESRSQSNSPGATAGRDESVPAAAAAPTLRSALKGSRRCFAGDHDAAGSGAALSAPAAVTPSRAVRFALADSQGDADSSSMSGDARAAQSASAVSSDLRRAEIAGPNAATLLVAQASVSHLPPQSVSLASPITPRASLAPPAERKRRIGTADRSHAQSVRRASARAASSGSGSGSRSRSAKQPLQRDGSSTEQDGQHYADVPRLEDQYGVAYEDADASLGGVGLAWPGFPVGTAATNTDAPASAAAAGSGFTAGAAGFAFTHASAPSGTPDSFWRPADDYQHHDDDADEAAIPAAPEPSVSGVVLPARAAVVSQAVVLPTAGPAVHAIASGLLPPLQPGHPDYVDSQLAELLFASAHVGDDGQGHGDGQGYKDDRDGSGKGDAGAAHGDRGDDADDDAKADDDDDGHWYGYGGGGDDGQGYGDAESFGDADNAELMCGSAGSATDVLASVHAGGAGSTSTTARSFAAAGYAATSTDAAIDAACMRPESLRVHKPCSRHDNGVISNNGGGSAGGSGSGSGHFFSGGSASDLSARTTVRPDARRPTGRSPFHAAPLTSLAAAQLARRGAAVPSGLPAPAGVAGVLTLGMQGRSTASMRMQSTANSTVGVDSSSRSVPAPLPAAVLPAASTRASSRVPVPVITSVLTFAPTLPAAAMSGARGNIAAARPSVATEGAQPRPRPAPAVVASCTTAAAARRAPPPAAPGNASRRESDAAVAMATAAARGYRPLPLAPAATNRNRGAIDLRQAGAKVARPAFDPSEAEW